MKTKYQVLFFGAMFSLMLVSYAEQETQPVLRGPYLGRSLPGETPEVFDSRITAGVEMTDIPLFRRGGTLLLFKGAVAGIDGVYLMEMKDGLWTLPRMVMPLSPHEDRHFFLTQDEKRILFTSRRPAGSEGQPTENPNIWFLDRKSSGWSRPMLLPCPISTDQAEFYTTTSDGGSLYFSRFDGEKCSIFRAVSNVRGFAEVASLGAPVNSRYSSADPCIAPDESYLIFISNEPRGLGQYDFYLTVRSESGSWTEPQHLGPPLSSEANDVCPLVTQDGRVLFFGSNRSGRYRTYWVDFQAIEIHIFNTNKRYKKER